MRRLYSLVLILLLWTTASAQWVEKTVNLPFGQGSLVNQEAIVGHPSEDVFYVAGGYRILALDGQTLEIIRGADMLGGVDDICLGPDAQKLYAMHLFDESLRVYDATTLEPAGSVALPGEISSVASSPAVDRIYVVCREPNCLVVLDASTDSIRRTIPLRDWGHAVAVNTRLLKAYCPVGESLYVIDAASDSVWLRGLPHESNRELCYDTLDGELYCGMFDKKLAILDGSVDSLVAVLEMPRYLRGGMILNYPERKLYMTNSGSYGVTIVDALSNSLKCNVPTGDGPYFLTYNSANNMVYCVNLESSDITVIDGAGDSVLTTVPVGGRPRAILSDSARNRVLSTNKYGLAIIDGNTNQVDGYAYTGLHTGDVLWNRSNGKLYVAHTMPAGLSVLDGTTLDVHASLFDIPATYSLAYSPTSQKVYAATGTSRSVVVICARGDSILRTIPLDGDAEHLCYSRSGDRIYCAVGAESSVVAIDCETDSIVAKVGLPGCYRLVHNYLDNKVYGSQYSFSSVAVIDAAADTALGQVEVDRYPEPVCYVPASNRVYVGSDYNDSVYVIDCRDDSVVATYPVGDWPHSLGWVSQHNDVCCASDENTIVIIDDETDSIVKTIRIEFLGEPLVCYNPASDKVFVTVSDENDFLVVIDGASRNRLADVSVFGWPTGIDCDSLSNRVFVAGGSAVHAVADTVWVGTSGSWQEGDLKKRVPTVINNVLTMSGRQAAELFDLTGRKVMDLQPGPNDIRHVAPGVYFVREEEPRIPGSEGPGVRKVVIQR